MNATRYGSTRGGPEDLSCADIIFKTISEENGGLYLPHEIPCFSEGAVEAMRGQPLPEVIYRVLILLGLSYNISAMELRKLCYDAYKEFQTDENGDILPIKHFAENGYIANFHFGLTQAFKDYALAVVGKIVEYLLAQQGKYGSNPVATSGDTGPAGQANVASDRVNVTVLYPHGGTSGGQERQMVFFSSDKNTQAYAIDGESFDGCQSMIRSVFDDVDFKNEMLQQDKVIFAANSINWLRIAVQIGYEFYLSLKPEFKNISDLTIVIPSGNFGSALAALYAKMMGAPITRVHMATNENDILARVLATGCYNPQKTIETTSPAMDIGDPQNWERILHTFYGPEAVADWFKDGRSFRITEELDGLQEILQATSVSMAVVRETSLRFYAKYGFLLDPHSTTAVYVAESLISKNPQSAVLAHSSAHSSKFEEAVRDALSEDFSLELLYRGISKKALIPYQMSEAELSSRRKIITDISPEIVKNILRQQ